MKIVSIVGSGNLGLCIGKAASLKNKTKFYDLDSNKSRIAASLCAGIQIMSVEEILQGDIIFLSLPGNVIPGFIKRYYYSAPCHALWVNLSTFITKKELLKIVVAEDNIMSCKIIGQAGLIPHEKIITVVDKHLPEFGESVNEVLDVFGQLGDIVYDEEEKYSNANYYAAEAGMMAVLKLAGRLMKKRFSPNIIYTLIQHTFIGTSRQFPYFTPDYFHEFIFSRNKKIRKLYDLVVKNLSMVGIKLNE